MAGSSYKATWSLVSQPGQAEYRDVDNDNGSDADPDDSSSLRRLLPVQDVVYVWIAHARNYTDTPILSR